MPTEKTRELDRAVVVSLLKALDARAAGLWKVEGDALKQICFVPADDLDAGTARSFASDTRLVSLAQTNLGIVQAVLKRLPALSLAADLPADSGSGLWLRAFGADLSIAVPLFDRHDSPVRFVLAVALADSNRDVEEVAAAIRTEAKFFGI